MFRILNPYLFGSFLFFLAGCGTMPKQKLEVLKKTPSERIYSSVGDLLKKNPPTLSLNEKSVDFSFSEKNPVLNTKFGPSTAVTLKIKVHGPSSFLTIWGYLHSVQFGNPGAVVPEIYIFDSAGKAQKSNLVQIGEEANCGLMRCMKMTYDISSLENGLYDLVLVAHVEDPEKPLRISTGSGVIFLGAVAVPTTHSMGMFADYFGDARVSFESQLPLKSNQEDVFTRTK